MRHFFIIMILTISVGTISLAQSTLTGNISDSEEGFRLAGVKVTIKGTRISTITDSEGRYIILVPENKKTVIFQKEGYQVQEVKIDKNIINIVMTARDVYIFALSLEDLMNIKVKTATKSDVKLSEAPAIVSVITRKDIEAKGFTTVTEALTSIGSVNSIETYWGYNQVFFRGMYSTLYNDKSLVLVNGHPLWDAINGSFYIETFPIEAIERIEVIRGPGSTLYGTNAYAGVINIITKPTENENVQSSAYFRSGGFRDIDASVVLNHTAKDISFNWVLQGKYSDGYNFTLPEVEGGRVDVPYNHINNFVSSFLNISYKRLSIESYSFFQEKAKIDSAPFAWGSLNQTRNEFRFYFYGLTYDILKNDKWDVSIRGSYNTMFRKFYSRYALNHGRYESDGYRADAELNAGYKINDNISLLAGALYEYVNADYYNFIDMNTDKIIAYGFGKKAYSDFILSSFLQSEIKLGKRINLIAGIRFSYNEHYKNIFTPRGGIVFKATKNLNIKALYGNAFRVPNLFEKYWAFGTTFGTENLDPEIINSYEFSVDYTKSKISAKVNYFYNIAKDLIGRELQADNTTKYVNFSGESVTQGVETELRYKDDKFDAYFNGAYLLPHNKDENEINYIPQLMFSTGIGYVLNKLSTHISLNYTQEVTNTVATIDEKIDALYLINAKIGYKLTRNITLSLLGKNLTNQEVWAPEFIRQNIIKLPNGYGRTIMLEIRAIFNLGGIKK